MRKAGVQDRVIMAITGHKTMSVFMRYDAGPELDELHDAIRQKSVTKCVTNNESENSLPSNSLKNGRGERI